ncbi:DUF2934 domain-containing protein [Variibacter gotjawalensis]|uniref:DUF2934 domain-containing protein n=1 Tax=Variibacter gotjawalensis TaxID=1333996 RepID=UPI0010EBCC44|nr:DUF2934 domain-containing protein [Variibacter gotjawalensis]NIK47691.1 hypothetical protein [Variibacter gotjawalensis]RZS49587.1 DUF2934 family protein [Variibacter gotjawalensis]
MSGQKISEDAIRFKAFELWELEGRPDGRASDHWAAAENLLADIAPHSEKSKSDLSDELDNALEDSFPASDPPSLSQSTGSEPAGDPKTKP